MVNGHAHLEICFSVTFYEDYILTLFCNLKRFSFEMPLDFFLYIQHQKISYEAPVEIPFSTVGRDAAGLCVGPARVQHHARLLCHRKRIRQCLQVGVEVVN